MSTIIEGVKLFTIPEVAEAMGVTPQTVRKYIKAGKLKSQRIGRPIYVTESNILKFVNSK